MLNITPEIADSIYNILIELVGAPDEEHFRWSFCYNATFDFPNPMPYCLQSKLVPPYHTNAGQQKKNNAIRVYDGNPIYLKVEEPEDWQIKSVAEANQKIAQYLKRVLRPKRKRAKCLAV